MYNPNAQSGCDYCRNNKRFYFDPEDTDQYFWIVDDKLHVMTENSHIYTQQGIGFCAMCGRSLEKKRLRNLHHE